MGSFGNNVIKFCQLDQTAKKGIFTYMFQFVKYSKLFALHRALQEQHVKRNCRIIELNNDIYKKKLKKNKKTKKKKKVPKRQAFQASY